MKTTTITKALLCGALALPIGLTAQVGSPDGNQQRDTPAESRDSSSTGSWDNKSNKNKSHDKSHKMGASAEIKAISEEKLESKVTAKNILDKDIYDRDGERVGTVADFAVALPGSLEQKLNGNKEGSAAMGSSSASRDDASYSAGSDTERPAGSSTYDAGASASAGQQDQQEMTLFVRVGGTMGMGGDHVSIPADQLDYDSENERFVLNLSKEEIEEIAESGSDGDREYSATDAR